MRNAVILSSLLGLTAVSLLAGCPDRTISQPDVSQGRVEYKDIPVTVNRDIDILFLIDDSPSMADKQNNLRMNFPNFINVLNTIQGGLPNIHIGVATSDLGSKGADDPSPGPGISGCTGTGKNGDLQTQGTTLVSGKFIVDTANTDGTRTTNYTGQLSDAFTAIASVGAAGCGFEQHIEAAKHALNNDPNNAGFVRPSVRIPDPAFQVALLAGHEEWMTGALVYVDPFWSEDRVGLRDPLLAELEERLG